MKLTLNTTTCCSLLFIPMASVILMASDALAQHLAEAPAAMTRKSLPKDFLSAKVKIRADDGSTKYSFKPKGQDCKFYDAQGKEICKIKLKSGKLKVKQGDTPLLVGKPKESKLMLLNPSGDELFRIRVKDQKIDVYRGEKRLYRLKHQSDDWKIENDSGQYLFQLGKKSEKTWVKNAAGKRVLYSKELSSPLGLAFFVMDELTPVQQATAAVFFADFKF